MAEYKETYLVRVIRPHGVSVGEMREYIVNAIGSWHGCYAPDEPIFDFNADSVRISRRVNSKVVKEKR